jgi:hypothetical protein
MYMYIEIKVTYNKSYLSLLNLLSTLLIINRSPSLITLFSLFFIKCTPTYFFVNLYKTHEI